MTIDVEAIRREVRALHFKRGSLAEVAMWREDDEDSRANLAIEDMDLTPEDQALFAMMLDEGLSPAAMVEVIRGLYEPGRAT